jgi:hypothetical protein
MLSSARLNSPLLLLAIAAATWAAGAVCCSAGSSQAVDVVAVIEPELSFAVDPQLDYSTLASLSGEFPTAEEEVEMTVSVESNLGNPYQVIQQLILSLAADKHAWLAEAVRTGSLAMNEQPLTLLSSDKRGTSESRTIPYAWDGRLAPAAGAAYGTILMTIIAQ